MCDTQVLIQRGVIWFAKNSDREPSEAQPVLRLPAVSRDPASRVRTTYLDIPQVPDRHGVILSKPHWIWGAEMGANDRGVVIGNEAIFSRVVGRAPALLGMDLVRLGLERGGTAAQALSVITQLLEQHGQGGPAGFRDKGFCYDNSFIVADATEAWVLETAARHWAAKRVRGFAAISNCLTLGTDFELHSAGLHDFARQHGRWDGRGELDFARSFDTWLLPYFGRAQQRRKLSLSCLANTAHQTASFAYMASHLRMHAQAGDDPLSGSNADVCLHAAGFIRRSQTTGSMISRLAPGDARHVLTGSSAPCLSLFRPICPDPAVGSSLIPPEGNETRFWWRQEQRHRRALFDAALRTEIRQSRMPVEQAIFSRLDQPTPPGPVDYTVMDQLAQAWERSLDMRLPAPASPPRLHPAGFYWHRLNRLDGLASVAGNSR
jgi:secernin